MSRLHSCVPLAYSDNEHAKQLLYALDNSVWGMKIIALEESADFATLDTENLYSKVKSHELSRKSRSNHDASLTSNALITSAHVGDHDANPTNTTVSSALKFGLSSLAAASDEQYKSIPDNEIALLVRKFCALHKFHARRGGYLLGALSSAASPPTSSPTIPRGRSSTPPPPISMTTPRGTSTARATKRRSTLRGQQEEKILEDHVLSVCCPQRL
jgi:hypothetical protein